ncbi:MAG: glycosyltransferase family 2 protein [Fusicatenibacter sp.]
MDKLYIIAPAYNEAENIEKLVDDWYPVIAKHHGDGQSRLVIVNDGSKDNTYELICSCAKTRPLLQPLTKTNGGHGSALLYGYRYAIDHQADYIFQTDSDGQTNPAEFGQFWDCRKEYDAVIGARPDRQDGKARKFVEDVLIFLLRIIFGVKLPDSNAPFRLMKRELLEKYIDQLPSDFNLPNVMLTTYFAYFHEPMKFIEISFRPRQGGTNSIHLKKIIKIGWKALGDFRMLRKRIQNEKKA